MSTKRKTLVLIGLVVVTFAIACVRAAPATVADDLSHSAETEDAAIQLTLQALLGSATVQSVDPTATLGLPTATPTVEGLQLTALAATLTQSAVTPSATLELVEAATETQTPGPTSAPCFAARYAYDESYPDGTRVDPGQSIQKIWRLQNIGSCDWVGGQYELVFVGGDRMNGTSPLTINITVPSGGYANFTINLTAPADPGTYHGDWILRTKGGETIGLGPNADLPFWIEIIVRG